MKKLYLISLLLSAITLHAQVPPEATLLVFGTGQNKEEAIENALYNSIEQTWKSFVSTNTATLDTLQKDGLTRKSTEIIKSFSELATVERSGDNISATLRVIVAIDKVLKFAESTHTPIELITTEFNSNMRLIGLHRHNSIVAIDSLLLVLKDVSSSMFDYNFRASAPIAVENGYKFSGVVEVTVNEQAKAFYNLICITYNALQADCFVPAQNGTMKKAWISQNRNKFEYNPKFRTSCLGNYEFKEDYVRGEQHAYFVGIPYTIFMLENMAIKNCRVTTNTGIP